MRKFLSIIECILAFVAVALFLLAEMFTRTVTYKTDLRDIIVLDEEKATFTRAIYDSDFLKEFVNADLISPLKIIGAIIMISLAITALLALLKCLVPAIKKLEKVVENNLIIIFSVLATAFSIVFVIMGGKYDLGLSMGEFDTYYFYCTPELFYYVYIVLLVAIIVCDLTARSKSISVSEGKSVTVGNKSSESIESLKQYKELYDSGAITAEEYEEKKKQLLNL